MSTQPLPEGWALENLEAIAKAKVGTAITSDMKRAATMAVRVARGECWDDHKQEWVGSPIPVNRDKASRAELIDELTITDKLLNDRQEVIAIIPPCPQHGEGCLPHAKNWIRAMCEITSRIKELEGQ